MIADTKLETSLYQSQLFSTVINKMYELPVTTGKPVHKLTKI